MARGIAQLKLGEPHEALQLLHLPTNPPPPAPGFVLVRITIRPIHPYDLILIRTGRLLSLPPHLLPPFVGCEGFGLVHQVGEGVTKFKPGQRVVPMLWNSFLETGQGTWQDYVVLSEDEIVAVPDSISDETAAQSVINPWTLYGLLDDLAIPKGEYVLQTAAASVLGRQLIQLAKHWGIKTINVVRQERWKEELKALGADEVINSESEDIDQRVKEITGGKLAYGGLDAVGGSLTKTVAASVRAGGKVFVYGVLSGNWDIALSILDMMRGVTVSWWVLPSYISSAEKEAQVCKEVMKLLEDKVITPLEGKKFALEDFLTAIEESEKKKGGGKVLLIS